MEALDSDGSGLEDLQKLVQALQVLNCCKGLVSAQRTKVVPAACRAVPLASTLWG